MNPRLFLAWLALPWLVFGQGEPVPEAPDAPPDPVATRTAAEKHARVRQLPNGDTQVGTIILHRQEREISFPAEFLPGVNELEVVIATPNGRLHESLLKADIGPVQLQFTLYALGLNNGLRIATEAIPRGDLVDLDVAWTDAAGQRHREPLESWILDGRTGQPMARIGWVFVGSGMKDGIFLADEEGNICLNYSVGSTILDIPDEAGMDDTIFKVNRGKPLPGPEAEVRVFLVPRPRVQEERK